jgi:hypothetical protein
VLTFLSPEELSRQQLSALPRSWASQDGGEVFSGLLPTGEAIAYVTEAASGRVRQVNLATETYYLEEKRVRSNEPHVFELWGMKHTCGVPRR